MGEWTEWNSRPDYSMKAIENMLLNWDEMEVAEGEVALIMKWDMEMAIACLHREERLIANTLRLMGETVLRSHAVKRFELGGVVKRLYNVLNVEGLVPEGSTQH